MNLKNEKEIYTTLWPRLLWKPLGLPLLEKGLPLAPSLNVPYYVKKVTSWWSPWSMGGGYLWLWLLPFPWHMSNLLLLPRSIERLLSLAKDL